jgi:NAD(P)-dependent dehydrogenase (short-subunit alcohol dehydrogenase family)
MTPSKHILIGGITGGIGSALARRLQEDGHRVSGFARDQARATALEEATGIKVKLCDATDPEALDAQIQGLASEAGGIDGYVHAIGSIYLKPAHLTPVSDWEQTIGLNLHSAFYALRSVAKLMQKQGHGNCLFFSTAAAQIGIANHEAIAAAKGGIEAMVRSAAATYASRGLRFNAIAPSLTDTPMAQPIVGNPQALEISKKMHPLNNIANPADVAGLAAWLLSDEAKFVTGQIFVVDGGLSTIVPKPRA